MTDTVQSRFLRYVSFDTQSARESSTSPSTTKQLKLAEALVEELKSFGLENAHVGNGGVVYTEIPASKGCEACPSIGFIAHMDTSPDASGENVKPQILRYEGGDVVLNAEKNIVFRAADFPEITKYAGEDIIFTDGTTLLGADDKAGIAAIMTMAAEIAAHPEIPHARLAIGFTPDEEVARGTENFDIGHFGAKYAYTFDGGEVGTLGLAKDKMVNSLRYAAKFMEMLPAEMSPECTVGHEGFLHPNMMQGNVVATKIRILIRDHDAALYEAKKTLLLDLVEKMNALYPQAKAKIEIKDSYQNMRPYLDRAPKVLEIAREAYRAAGLDPIEEPIRGGTDGARLSVRGLPCPNVFTGGMNFHGIYECIPVKSLEKGAEVAMKLAQLSGSIKSLD